MVIPLAVSASSPSMPTPDEIRRALSRIRTMMPREKIIDRAQRDIRLGLERIKRVVTEEQTWTGIHVAGTNGKGTICALLANMLRRNGLSHGVFVSPALPEPHNCILINGRFINKRTYEGDLVDVHAAYHRAISAWQLIPVDEVGDLTPFEAQTAAAFRLFNRMRVKYGIVETGMGGGTDATNAMKTKALTVISKIDLDHLGYLGDSIEKIAEIKAGIMRPRVPCVVDHTNPTPVQRVLFEQAQKIQAPIHLSSKVAPLLEAIDQERFQLEEYEKQNLMCATMAFRILFPNVNLDLNRVVGANPSLPGRKDTVKVTDLTQGARQKPILVDGAHNALGVAVLANHVQNKVRQGDQPVTWIMGLSSGKLKPVAKMIETLVQPQDNVAFVQYTQESTDPEPVHYDFGRDIAKELLKDASQIYSGSPSVEPAIHWACGKAGEGPIVLTGSLYLVRDFYRLEGVRPWLTIGTMRPGLAQLIQYNKLARERALTPEEEAEFKRARRHRRLNPRWNPNFRDGGTDDTSTPPEVPERIRELQRRAAHHRRQADAYKTAIEGLKNDALGRVSTSESGETEMDGAAESSQSVEAVEKQQQKHRNAYQQVMPEIRAYFNEVGSGQSTYTQPSGSRKPAEGRVAALMRKHGMDEAIPEWPASGKSGVVRKSPDTAQAEDKTPDESRFWGKFGQRWTENGGEADRSENGGNDDRRPGGGVRMSRSRSGEKDGGADRDRNTGDDGEPRRESKFRSGH